MTDCPVCGHVLTEDTRLPGVASCALGHTYEIKIEEASR